MFNQVFVVSSYSNNLSLSPTDKKQPRNCVASRTSQNHSLMSALSITQGLGVRDKMLTPANIIGRLKTYVEAKVGHDGM